MKLIDPLIALKNSLSDIRKIHDFNYTVPAETRDEFWNKECLNHPTASTCKIYEE